MRRESWHVVRKLIPCIHFQWINYKKHKKNHRFSCSQNKAKNGAKNHKKTHAENQRKVSPLSLSFLTDKRLKFIDFI